MERFKKVIDGCLSATVFKILIVIITMAISVPFVHMAVGSYVKLVLIYGFAVICWGIVRKNYRDFVKDKLNLLLAAFAVSYLITILINYKLNFFENIKDLAYMAVFFALLYVRSEGKELKSLIKEMKVVSGVVISCTFVLSLASFAMYILLIEGHYMTENGFMYYGMYENRLWGVYNANTGSTLNGISILLSLGFICADKKKVIAVILNSVNILLQFCCLILTGSRAALYTVTLLVSILVFIYTVRLILNKKGRAGIGGAAVSACAALVTVSVCVGCSSLAKYGLSYLPGAASDLRAEIFGESEDQIQEEEGRYNLDRMEEIEERDGGFFNGRTDIWEACIKSLRGNVLFGVSRENVVEEAGVYLRGSHWLDNLKIGGPHSIYVCILISSGLIGLIIMMEFAVFSLRRGIKAVARNIKTVNIWMITALLITVFFFITEIVEARIMYQVNVFYALFWIYCGYMNAIPRKMNVGG